MNLIEFFIKAAEHTKAMNRSGNRCPRSYVISDRDDMYSLDIHMPQANEIFAYEEKQISSGGQLLVSKNSNGYHQAKSYDFSHYGQQIPEGTQTIDKLSPYIKVIKEYGHRAIVNAILGSK